MGNLSPQIHLSRRAIRITFSSTDTSAQNYQHNLFFLAESEFDVCLTQEDLLFPAPVVLSGKAFYSASFQCGRQSSEWGDELQEWDSDDVNHLKTKFWFCYVTLSKSFLLLHFNFLWAAGRLFLVQRHFAPQVQLYLCFHPLCKASTWALGSSYSTLGELACSSWAGSVKPGQLYLVKHCMPAEFRFDPNPYGSLFTNPSELWSRNLMLHGMFSAWEAYTRSWCFSTVLSSWLIPICRFCILMTYKFVKWK